MTMPSLKVPLPGFERFQNRLIHAAVYPGVNLKGYRLALIHGIGASSATWMPLIARLHHVMRDFLVMDMPGHGLSPDPALPFSCLDAYHCVRDCLLRHLDPEDKNIILGNSLGGAFAMRFAMEYPDYAHKCIFISPAGAPFPTTAHDIIAPFCLETLAEARQIIQRIFGETTPVAFILAPALLYTAKQSGYLSMMKSITDIDDNPEAPLAKLLFSQEELQHFSTPSLFIWGAKDAILPSPMRDYFDANLPPSTTRLFPKTYGHCPQFNHTRELSQDIIQWLKAAV